MYFRFSSAYIGIYRYLAKFYGQMNILGYSCRVKQFGIKTIVLEYKNLPHEI